MTFDYIPHPHIGRRKLKGAPKHADSAVSLGDRLGLRITAIVGTMACAVVFAVLAIVSLPSAIQSGDKIIIVAWIAQTFLQLVLLPVIIVGQNVQAKASDKRAEATYKDAESVLAECMGLQRHLAAQDAVLADLITHLKQGPA